MQLTKNSNGPPFPAMARSYGMAVTAGGGLCLQPKPQIRETVKYPNPAKEGYLSSEND